MSVGVHEIRLGWSNLLNRKTVLHTSMFFPWLFQKIWLDKKKSTWHQFAVKTWMCWGNKFSSPRRLVDLFFVGDFFRIARDGHHHFKLLKQPFGGRFFQFSFSNDFLAQVWLSVSPQQNTNSFQAKRVRKKKEKIATWEIAISYIYKWWSDIGWPGSFSP